MVQITFQCDQTTLDQQVMSASEEQLKALRAQIKDGIRKIDETMKPKPFWQRVRAHVGRNQSNLTNVVLAGSLFAVAIGRYAVAKQLEVCRPVYGCQSCKAGTLTKANRCAGREAGST